MKQLHNSITSEVRERAAAAGLTRRRRAHCLALTVSSLALTIAAVGPTQVLAQSATPASDTTASKAATDLSEVVVNGIPFKETVLPTRLSSSSVYGLNLNVMDTPRNTTLLSTTQLETLNIQDPRAFSYLTSSSYTDSSFGTPNIPRIRGQYADVFYNGMRDSFTQNGYGAPINFDAFQNISITKGPASVIDGPGADVGGEVDFLTKRPNLAHFTASGSATVDSVGNHRLNVDVGGPIIKDELGVVISYSGEDSQSYFFGHYLYRNAVYAAMRWTPNDKYSLDFNTEVNDERYTEDVGVNRVNQNLINHGQYLQGGPDGTEYDSSIFFANNGVPIPTGLAAGTGNPFAAAPVLTEIDLTNSVKINPRVTIDQTAGTSTRALLYNAQLIQSYNFNADLILENNTFFAFQNSDNQEGYYYADASNGSYSIENRTDLKYNFDLPFAVGSGGAPIKNEFIGGLSVRYAWTSYISDFSAETASVYDLTANPARWVFNPSYQGLADAFTYKTSLGRVQFGVPGRDITGNGNTGVSGLWDTALFFQDRMVFSPQWSVLFGARIDAVQNHSYDPLGGPVCDFCFTALPNGDPLPQSHTTGIYGLGDGNISVVYQPQPWVSGYLTFDWTQSVNPNGGEGGVNTYGQVPDSELMRQTSYLYEAGLKFNLLNNKLFAGLAVFDQKRNVPTGFGGTVPDAANIRGVEVEANYQPTRNFFATASYSYINTTLTHAPQFYDYPAEQGVNVDGAGLLAVFKPGQTFEDPGMPQHVFNVLGNYKFDNGFGVRSGLQVTGPISVAPSGQLDLTASGLVPAGVVANNGYLKSPVIPWQYTLNAAIFYEYKRYTVTFSVYNLTDQHNWQPSPTLYGDDFLVLDDPRTFEIRLQAKF